MTNTWRDFCETAKDGFSAVFRLAIAIVMIPHCYLEWPNLPDLIRFNEENMGPVSHFLILLTGLVMILEGISLVLVCIGMFGKLSVAILGSSICFHFFPSEEILFNLFWNNYRIYVLLFPILFYVMLRGSGRFSIDRWLFNANVRHEFQEKHNETIL